ncbi:MAG: sulfite exporter TauE/SafE family protein [Variibacter sp.]|nr:sulfite exporter TauE/SafE family protein [Variibacter sp.]
MDTELTLQALGVVWLGAFLGGISSGGAGFGFAVVASAIWLHAIDPVRATALVVASGITLQAALIWPMRRKLDPQRLWPFLVAGLAGVPIGVYLLAHLKTDALKLSLGLFLVLFGLYALMRPRLPYVGGGGRAADAAVGFVSGIMGGIGGYSGVLPTIWTQLRGWPKDVARGVYQPFILTAHVATLALVGFVAFDRMGLILLAHAIPPLLAGGWVGWKIYGRLDERRFRQALAVLLVVSGAALVL